MDQGLAKVRGKNRINSDNHTMADFVVLKDKDLFAKTVNFFDYVDDWKSKGTYHYRRKLLSSNSNRIMVQDKNSGKGREMIMMASNNYLGIGDHPEIIMAGKKALEKYGSGMSGSPLLNGTYDILRELEEKIADIKGCEEAMLFSTGYSANVGAITGMMRPGDIVIIDRLDHASIIDGCNMSGVPFRAYKHNDMKSLETLLEKCDKEFLGKLIVFDGVFSMDGDLAPLPEIYDLAKKHGAKVMVDDAHGTGVIGKHGGGTTEHFGLKGKVDFEMGTFSKTLASTGGFLASTRKNITYLRHHSRAYMFSASLTPSVVATVSAGLDIIKKEPERREKLWENITYMHKELVNSGFNVFPSLPESAIITITIGNEVKLREMSREIDDAGIFLNAVPYPAVPKEKCRFRISLMATHTRNDLDDTLAVLRKVGKKYEVI